MSVLPQPSLDEYDQNRGINHVAGAYNHISTYNHRRSPYSQVVLGLLSGASSLVAS